jgi:hypothetical protein
VISLKVLFNLCSCQVCLDVVLLICIKKELICFFYGLSIYHNCSANDTTVDSLNSLMTHC